MKSRRNIILAILLFALFLIGASQLYRFLGSSYTPPDAAASGTGSSGEEEKMLAPNFTVTDAEGNAVRLSDLRGTPVVLNFWASWCPPCKAEMPDFDEAFAEFGDTIHFLMVNSTDGSRETVETASDFIAEEGYRFPVYYDTAHEASRGYAVSSLPTTVFIDGEGCLVDMHIGMIDNDTLRKGIEAITPAQ